MVGFLHVPAGRSEAGTLPAVTLAWNRNPEPDVAGYEIHYGTTRGNYPTVIKVGSATRYKVAGLKDGSAYYFVIHAVNRAGLRSKPSRVIAYGVQPAVANRAPDGKIARPGTRTTVYAGDWLAFAGQGTDPDGDRSLTLNWQFGKGSGIADAKGANPGAVRFAAPGTYQVTLTVTDSQGKADPSPASVVVRVLPALKFADRAPWRIAYASSEESAAKSVAMATDGKSATFWQTATRTAYLPRHELRLDLGSLRHVAGFRYLPRQDGVRANDLLGYQLFVSADGLAWGNPVASGSFSSSDTLKTVLAQRKHGRFIRLVGTTGDGGNAPLAVAELQAIESPVANRAPKVPVRTVKTTLDKPLAFKLAASDPDGNPLKYSIVGRPSHGRLSGVAPQLTYTPAKGFTGTDRVSFRVSDGIATSATVTWLIQVKRGSSATVKSAVLDPIKTSSVAAAGAVQGVTTIAGKKYLALTVPKPAKPDGAKRWVEVSSNRVDWFSGRRHTTVLADNARFLKVRDNTPLEPGVKRHIRLRVGSGQTEP